MLLFVKVSGSYDLCSTAGFVLESEAVEVILSAGEPLALFNIELVSATTRCEDSGPR